ncbi:MAG TPA: MarR family transcriptional regulator [Dongiaceae bacterium]|nr:MarR family transcriptional regulator [Dongiaceae bacterium]
MRKSKVSLPVERAGDNRKKAAIPVIGEGKRGESGHLGYLLRQAAGGFRLSLERALADFDVTQPQFVVMTMIAAYPGASNADLARLAMLTPQTLSTIIANLLRAEIVSRHPHAIHGRIQQLLLTESGAKLLAKCRDRVAHLEAQLLAGLAPGEEQAVRRWLVKAALLGRTQD